MSLEGFLAQVQRSVPECVACGMVDMATGRLLGMRTDREHPQEALDTAAAAAADLFEGGQRVVGIENVFVKMRSSMVDVQSFQEILVSSESLLHIFQRCKRDRSRVLVIVTRVSANLGMVLSRARIELERIEASI